MPGGSTKPIGTTMPTPYLPGSLVDWIVIAAIGWPVSERSS
jgi:hypothetical protein